MSNFDLFAFQIYPYIALAVFLVGSWVRFDKSMYTWRTGSSRPAAQACPLRLR